MHATPKESLNQRWSALVKERSSWIGHWQDLGEMFLPRSGRYNEGDRNDGRKKHNNILDSTCTRACRILAAGLMGGATSPARPWFRLAIADRDLMQRASVKQWLHASTSVVLTMFQRSNTYRALHTAYGELGVYGTHAIVVMEDFNKVIHLYPLTAGQYCLATDEKGNVNTLYREFQLTVKQMVGQFGYNNCSQEVRTLYNNKSYEKTITVYHAIEPRLDRDVRKIDSRNMAYKSVYWEKGQEENGFLKVSGFRRFTVLAPRWVVTTGDDYGESPAMEALGDGRQLQHQQKRKAQGIDYHTKPPLQIPPGMKNNPLNAMPGGITHNTGQGRVESLFQPTLRLDFLLDDIRDVRERISQSFYTDLFLMIANTNDHRMTATEVAERQEEKLLMLGPVLERLHNELLEPLVDIAFSRALEANLLPPPPPELQGTNLQVEFVSVLAQAQKAVSTTAVDRYVLNMGQIAQLKPEVLDKFNQDEWADIYADVLGVDPSLIVPDREVALVRQQRQEAAQAQAQLEQSQVAADTMHKMSGASTEGNNILSNIVDQFSGYTTR